MTTKQLKYRGFTHVELLIVIVIIAILTVISLIAYNGIQNQAKTSASQGVMKNVADKAQIYNTQQPDGANGYPAAVDDLSAAGKSGETWYLESSAYVVGGSSKPTSAPTGADASKTIWYKVCNDAKGRHVGITIWGWDFSKNEAIERVVGEC